MTRFTRPLDRGHAILSDRDLVERASLTPARPQAHKLSDSHTL